MHIHIFELSYLPDKHEELDWEHKYLNKLAHCQHNICMHIFLKKYLRKYNNNRIIRRLLFYQLMLFKIKPNIYFKKKK